MVFLVLERMISLSVTSKILCERRAMSIRSFIVTGFDLPVNMVYSGKHEVSHRVPSIAASNEAAQRFVSPYDANRTQERKEQFK
ncbi:hypothetical protein KIN20_014165 [Parelaphostrongylus tenuis]|uniref:Uncharacterized protein n=1 Tax=Parelaphostrongylus tenuis TaxID=148309 RepID=A0AAD5QLH1_PARTN|nr:hypothetical protein KIN20_014165 [Parelaphostrongylus tenuis]